MQFYLLSLNVSNSFILQESDFYPTMNSSTKWVFRKLSDINKCANNSNPFGGCVQSLDFNNMPNVATGENYPNGTRNFQFWTFSPIVNGYSLLGELGKIVNVSPKRFDSLQFPGNSKGTEILTVK